MNAFTDITYKYCEECKAMTYHLNNKCCNCKRNAMLQQAIDRENVNRGEKTK